MEELSDRDEDPGDDAGDGHAGGDDDQRAVEDAGEVEHDAERDESAHEERGDGVPEEPALLRGAVGGVAGEADVPDVAFDEVVDVVVGALREVGDFQEVGEDVVAVVAQERVGVEDDRGEAGDEHDVVGEGVGPGVGAGFGGVGPDHGGDGGDGEFDPHAGGADDGAVPFVGEGPGTGGVDVRDGGEDQEHDADDVDFAAGAALAAEFFTTDRVAHFVAGLDHGEGDIEPDQVFRIEHVAGGFHQAGGPVGDLADRVHAEAEQEHPDDEAGGGEDPAEEFEPALEEGVGIEDGDAREHDVHEIAGDFALFAFLIAGEERVGIGGDFRLKQVGGVELAQELDDFALSRGIVAQMGIDQRPGVADGPLAIEQANELIGGFGQAEKGVIGVVLHDMPGLTTKVLAGDLDGGAEARVEAFDAVPGFVECRAFDGHKVLQGDVIEREPYGSTPAAGNGRYAQKCTPLFIAGGIAGRRNADENTEGTNEAAARGTLSGFGNFRVVTLGICYGVRTDDRPYLVWNPPRSLDRMHSGINEIHGSGFF